MLVPHVRPVVPAGERVERGLDLARPARLLLPVAVAPLVHAEPLLGPVQLHPVLVLLAARAGRIPLLPHLPQREPGEVLLGGQLRVPVWEPAGAEQPLLGLAVHVHRVPELAVLVDQLVERQQHVRRGDRHEQEVVLLARRDRLADRGGVEQPEPVVERRLGQGGLDEGVELLGLGLGEPLAAVGAEPPAALPAGVAGTAGVRPAAHVRSRRPANASQSIASSFEHGRRTADIPSMRRPIRIGGMRKPEDAAVVMRSSPECSS